MKIVFLCGSLEPGRDGVGDYTRRLAAELTRRGHNASAVAMYDRHVAELSTGMQETEFHDLPVLRVPYKCNHQVRFFEVKRWIDGIDPDWVSLQFVPYSFHPKGIPLKFLSHIANWNSKYSWHIMFHELWLGAPKGIKENLISAAQQLIISRLISKLRPSLINVSIPYNGSRLKKIGVRATILKLFGNISPVKCERGSRPANEKNILYFGTPPRDTFLHKLVKELSSFCNVQPHNVNILVVAGESDDKDRFVKLLRQSLSDTKARVIDCGFVKSDALSLMISNSTLGIARSRPHLLGKSGSAIAMLEHGVPIWLPQWENDSAVQFNFRPHLIHRDLHKAARVSSHEAYRPLLPEVAENFLSQLTKRHVR